MVSLYLQEKQMWPNMKSGTGLNAGMFIGVPVERKSYVHGNLLVSHKRMPYVMPTLYCAC